MKYYGIVLMMLIAFVSCQHNPVSPTGGGGNPAGTLSNSIEIRCRCRQQFWF